VLEQGAITERGSYDELQAAGGLFSRLVNLQQVNQ
jgi:ABC-type multidrug transport system fused ATPase/permease subunit